MTNPIKIRHQSIISYVKNGSTLFNTIFLILHIGFGVFFKTSNADILYYYNILSIATYLISYVLLYINMSGLYSAMVNIEVYVFMILTTVCLGWDYGFQQYCIIFVVSLLFTDYCINQEHTLKKSTIGIITLVIATYFLLRIWTYSHPNVYSLENVIPERMLFIVNTAIAFSFLIAYSFLYSQTVYRLEQTLVEVATKDALTGLYNRRKMQDLLNAMSELLNSSSNQMCIAMIDVDNFKKINDTYGHDAGDEVLKAVADVLLRKSAKEESFYSCRWGGEEFLIFYRTNHQKDDAVFLEFDDLRKQFEQRSVLYNDQTIHFTATTGLAFYKDNLSIMEMIKLADENLYEGKESGKNVVIYKK